MAQFFKANDLTQHADLARLNQWISDANAEMANLRKLSRTLNAGKIDAKPERLEVSHVAIYQHFGDPSETQTLTANSTIMALGENLPIRSDADITLLSTPSITPPTRQGQILFIHNVGAFIITLQNTATFTGSSLRLQGNLLELGAHEAAIFMEADGEWLAHGASTSSVHMRQLRVTGDAIFVGNIYQASTNKAVDMQNMILHGTATIDDKAGFRTAIDAAQKNHVHDFTASGSTPYSYVLPGSFEGLDPDGNPIFGAPTTVNVTVPFTITGTTQTERQP